MGRREITDRTSWDDAYTQLSYTVDALQLAADDGDKEVGALAGAVEKVLTHWEAVDKARRAAKRGVARANALVRRRDHQADEAVAAIHNDALHAAKQDREHPVYQRLFPEPASTVIRMSLATELPHLRTLAGKLEEKETPATIRKEQQKPLAQAIERGSKALETREQAFVVQGKALADQTTWREDANAVLAGIEGKLLQLSSARRLGRGWVDTFFPELARPARKAKGNASESAPSAAPKTS